MIGFFRWLETKKYKVQVRVFLSRYRGYQVCPDCAGRRLRREALHVRVGGLDIDAVCALSVREAREFLARLGPEADDGGAGARVVAELERRLRYLADVGLDYLTLGRAFSTLSGGEAQRIALASALGTALVGTLYVLDEPSVGLHPRDTDRLIAILQALRDQGNTVVVVEHDRAIIRVADHVIDLGPGRGGAGRPRRVPGVVRGAAQRGAQPDRQVPPRRAGLGVRAARRQPGGAAIVVRGARAHNLKGIDVRIPLGAMTCVTGVSGSGKSTLVHDVVCAAIRRDPRAEAPASVPWDSVDSVERDRRGRDRRPVAHRPHAALQPGHLRQGVRPHPRAVRGHRRRPRPRPVGQPFLLQRPRRALRGLRRRRPGPRGHAVPRRRVPGLRGVRGQALPAGGPRGALARPLDRPGPGDDGAGGAALLRRPAGDRPAAEAVRRDRARLPSPGPAGDDALRRRGAAGEAGGAPRAAAGGAGALRARRADHRAAHGRHRASWWPAWRACAKAGPRCW